MEVTLHTDGGARGNPGPAAAGVVITAQDDSKESGYYLGDALTNNQAEYLGLINGLEAVKREYGTAVAKLSVFMDSELVIKQVRGEYKVKNPEMQKLHARVQALVKEFPMVQFSHVPRSENAGADALVNQVLDAKNGTN